VIRSARTASAGRRAGRPGCRRDPLTPEGTASLRRYLARGQLDEPRSRQALDDARAVVEIL